MTNKPIYDIPSVIEVLASVMCFNPLLDIHGEEYVPIYTDWIYEKAEEWGINLDDIIARQQEMLLRRIVND